MIRNISEIQVIIEEKTFRFICEQNSSLYHCKEALFQFSKCIAQIEDAAKKQSESQNEEKPKSECV